MSHFSLFFVFFFFSFDLCEKSNRHQPHRALLMHLNHYFLFPYFFLFCIIRLNFHIFSLFCIIKFVERKFFSFPLIHYQIYKDIIMEIEIHVTYFFNYYFFPFSFYGIYIFFYSQLYDLIIMFFSNKSNYVLQLLLFSNSKKYIQSNYY